MNPWTIECVNVLNRLTGSPRGSREEMVLALVGVLVLFVSFRIGVAWSDVRRPDLGRTILSPAGGVLVLVGAAAVDTLYFLPWLRQGAFASALTMVLPLVVGLLVGVPLQCVLLRARYVPMLMTFGVSVAITLLALIATGGMIESVAAGSTDSARLFDRQRQTEMFLNAR